MNANNADIKKRLWSLRQKIVYKVGPVEAREREVGFLPGEAIKFAFNVIASSKLNVNDDDGGCFWFP